MKIISSIKFQILKPFLEKAAEGRGNEFRFPAFR